MPKTVTLRPTSRPTRDAMREAHDLGRHGEADAPFVVLSYWAEICGDCNARYYYEFGPGRTLVSNA